MNMNIVIGSLQDHATIKTDDTCTTLTEAMGKGGGQTPMILHVANINPNETGQSGNVYNSNGLSPTLDTCQGGNRMPKIIEYPYRIRKLTPKECWRLMSFTDEDFHKAEKVNSNTQLYKQAGNSIAVLVLESIFKQMM